MIQYNLKYRGPFEYDKMILNIFQLSNEIKLFKNKIKDNELKILSQREVEFNKIYNTLFGENALIENLQIASLKVS